MNDSKRSSSPTAELQVLVDERISQLSDELLLADGKQLLSEMSAAEVFYEGRTHLFSSLSPTLVTSNDIKNYRLVLTTVRQMLNGIIQLFRDEHKHGQFNGLIHEFYKPYESWWDLIVSEARAISDIQLMRFDLAVNTSAHWSILETNTCCPGAQVLSPIIRTAWLKSKVAKTSLGGLRTVDMPIDRSSAFVRFMYEIACKIDGSSEPNIAVCNHEGVYTFEIENMQRQHEELKGEGTIAGGELILADIRDIDSRGDKIYVKNKPVQLIYNKHDPLMIKPAASELKGWFAAAKSRSVEFLNSLGAFYLTEAKRTLELLRDPRLHDLLKLNKAARDAVMKHVPVTKVIGEPGSKLLKEHLQILRSESSSYVVKPDALTRGSGIGIGKFMDAPTWQARVDGVVKNHGVMQNFVELPKRRLVCLVEGTKVIREERYCGLDGYFFGDELVGFMSRSHTGPIINVGSGGSLLPIIAVDG